MPMLVDTLRGVPKAALKTVLGKELGNRAWKSATSRKGGESSVYDDEIILALLSHLSRRAGDRLQRDGRRALVVSLSLVGSNGRLESGRMRLARATDDWMEILAEVETLYQRLQGERRSPRYVGERGFAADIRRLELDVTVTLPQLVPSGVPVWRWRTAAAGLA